MNEYINGNNTILNATEAIISNYTYYPTLQPTNLTLFTSIPSYSPTILSTSNPTQGEFHLVQDITNPAKFNFIAFMLGLSFLMIIVGVTATGFVLRCISESSKEDKGYRTQVETLEKYFIEDISDEYPYNSHQYHHNNDISKISSSYMIDDKYHILNKSQSNPRLYQNTIPLQPTNIVDIKSSYNIE